MSAVLNFISFIFEVKIGFVSVIYIRSRIRQLMQQGPVFELHLKNEMPIDM